MTENESHCTTQLLTAIATNNVLNQRQQVAFLTCQKKSEIWRKKVIFLNENQPQWAKEGQKQKLIALTLKKKYIIWNVLVVTAYQNKILYPVCAAPMVWALKERQTTGLASTNEM